MESVRGQYGRYLPTSCWCIRNQTRERSEQVRFLIQLSMLFCRLSSIFFVEGRVFGIWIQNYFNPISEMFFTFPRLKLYFMVVSRWMFAKQLAKRGRCKLQAPTKRREFWRETHTPLWLLIERIIFLTREKASFAIPIRRIFFFYVWKTSFAPLTG